MSASGCEVCGGGMEDGNWLVRTTPTGQDGHFRCQKCLPRWRCFHCGEVFCNAEDARTHFGHSIHADPACSIDAAKFREMEARCARYAEEDTDLHREIARLSAEHTVALRREEEVGYARGLTGGLLEAARLCRTEICPGMVSMNQMYEIADTIEAHAKGKTRPVEVRR